MTYIYILTRNNIPFYVGKTNTVNQRKSHHKKFKGSDLEFVIIDEVKDIEWKYWESFWINKFKTLGFELENKNNGGGGPTIWTEEQKLKINPERIEKIKNNKDRGNKISKTLLERDHSKYYNENIRNKMSENMKGSHGGPFTDIHIINLKEGLRKNSKRVLQYNLNGDFLKEWRSKGEAVEWITTQELRSIGQNVSSQIKDCCLGRMISCWGFIWRFKDEFIPVIPKYYPIEQYKDNILINTFYNELEAEKYILNNNLTTNKQKPRDLIKVSIKKGKKFCGFKWKYKE